MGWSYQRKARTVQAGAGPLPERAFSGLEASCKSLTRLPIPPSRRSLFRSTVNRAEKGSRSVGLWSTVPTRLLALRRQPAQPGQRGEGPLAVRLVRLRAAIRGLDVELRQLAGRLGHPAQAVGEGVQVLVGSHTVGSRVAGPVKRR